MDRRDRHSLMMGKISPDDLIRLICPQTGEGEIDGFIKAKAARSAQIVQFLVVACGVSRSDHRRKACGIGCDHEIVRQATLEAKARNPEVGVLVSKIEIPGGISRFGNAPRRVFCRAVGHLLCDHQFHGLFVQCLIGAFEHQIRHQILEHRPRPGYQARRPLDRHDWPTQPDPVFRCDIALGDREEAGQRCFRSQQVITALIERLIPHAITDGQKMTLTVEQKLEIHRVGEGAAIFGKGPQMTIHASGMRGAGQGFMQHGFGGIAQNADPVSTVRLLVGSTTFEQAVERLADAADLGYGANHPQRNEFRRGLKAGEYRDKRLYVLSGALGLFVKPPVFVADAGGDVGDEACRVDDTGKPFTPD